MPRLEEIIEFAIDQEKKAASRYERLANLVENPRTREMLLRMKAMEEEHREKLENLDIREFLNQTNDPILDLHLSDEKDIQSKLKDLTTEDILLMAADFENDARELYLILADQAPVGSATRDLFLKLAEEETQHKYDIESQLESGI
ncbi:MAG: Rubrerythrin [Candidatus Marinimicrobia bacterium]|jgi:rubrerythrin|nr:Rubrerythrin [Candidatus Neomarinimicrobiota bacterium]